MEEAMCMLSKFSIKKLPIPQNNYQYLSRELDKTIGYLHEEPPLLIVKSISIVDLLVECAIMSIILQE